MKKNLFLCFMLSLLLGILFIYLHFLPYVDNSEYDIVARNLLKGNGYSLSKQAPYVLDVYRAPGMVVFLYVTYKIFGMNYLIVKIIHAILNAIIPIFIFGLTRRAFNERIAYISAFIVAIFPFNLLFVPVVSSMILNIFLLCLGLFLFERGRGSGSNIYFILSGLTYGYCLLVRPGMALFPLFLSLAYIWVENIKKTWKYLLIFNLSVVLLWSPWFLRNYIVAGKFIPLTIESSEVLYWGSTSIGKYSENRMLNPKFVKQMEEIQSKLNSSGLVGLQRNIKEKGLYLEYAKQNIKDNPFIYLLSCLKRVPRIWISSLDSDNSGKSYGYLIFGGRQYILDLIKVFTLACLLLAIYGIWTLRNNLKKVIFLIMPLIYFSLTHIFFHPEARYTLPARPFLLIFAIIGLLGLVNKIYPRVNISL